MATTDPTLLIYYVYILFRENGLPFYVGKGKGYRWDWHFHPGNLAKHSHKNSIIKKVIALMGEVPRVKICESLSEADAHAMECALIKAIGRHPLGPLVNRTDGGEGMSNPSEETRAKLRAALALRGDEYRAKQAERSRNMSAETRAKISAAARGRKATEEARRNMSAAQKARDPEITRRIAATQKGKYIPPESRQRMKEAAMKRPIEVRKAQSALARSHLTSEARRLARLGKKATAEARANQSAALKGRQFSAEHRAKLGARARNRSPEHREKLRLAASNVSEDTRLKMREAAKKRETQEYRDRVVATRKANKLAKARLAQEAAAQDAPTPLHDRGRQYRLPL